MNRFFYNFLILSFVWIQTVESQSKNNYLKQAKNLSNKGLYKEAIIKYENALEESPNDLNILKEVLKLSGWVGNIPKYVSMLEKIYTLDETDQKIAYELSKQMQWNGRSNEAVPILEKLIEKDPKNIEYKKSFVINLQATNQHKKAVVIARDVLNYEPNDIDLLYYIAQICHWDTCWPEAKKNYQKILDINPKHQNSIKYLTLLKKDRAAKVKSTTTYYIDTTDVGIIKNQNEFETPVTGRISIGAEVTLMDINEKNNNKRAFLTEPGLKAKYNLTQQTSITTLFGFDSIDATEKTHFVNVTKFNTSLLNKIYPQIEYSTRAYTTSVTTIEDNISYHNLQLSIYAEPIKDLTTILATNFRDLSDDNFYRSVYGNIDYAIISDPFLIKTRYTYIDEDYDKIYLDSIPYFTADIPPSHSLGFLLGENFYDEDLWTEGGLSMTFRDGDSPSLNAEFKALYKKYENHQVSIGFNYTGSESFAYQLFTLQYLGKF